LTTPFRWIEKSSFGPAVKELTFFECLLDLLLKAYISPKFPYWKQSELEELLSFMADRRIEGFSYKKNSLMKELNMD